MRKLLRKLRRAVLDSDPSFCDMHDDAHARGAGEEYLAHIRRHLAEAFGPRQLAILDAGCQAGRLLIPLAQDGHQLIGIDTSGFALRRARRHAQERGLQVRLHEGTIGRLRHWVPAGSLDAVVCTEVLYLCEDYRPLLRLLVESVAPGGLLFVSHRPAFYYASSAMGNGRPDQALEMLSRGEGASPEGAYHNWQTETQLRALYAQLGADVLGCHPVDRLSRRLDLSLAPGPVRHVLTPFAAGGERFAIPAYVLVVAKKAKPET